VAAIAREPNVCIGAANGMSFEKVSNDWIGEDFSAERQVGCLLPFERGNHGRSPELCSC